MEKSKELELDIQYVKSLMTKCVYLYKNTLKNVVHTDKVINNRKKFILFQFRNIFDTSFWL